MRIKIDKATVISWFSERARRFKGLLLLGQSLNDYIALVLSFFVLLAFTQFLLLNPNYFSYNFLQLESIPYLLIGAAGVLLTILLVLVFRPQIILQTQVKHQSASWYWYIHTMIVYFPILFLTINFGTNIINILKEPTFLFFLLPSVTYSFIYIFVPERKETPLKFSYDAIGQDEDMLGFTKYIDGFIESMNKVSEPINVITLFGDLGSGKSSFIKMVFEKMFRRDFLYTYISLTETSEKKDFNKLFSERWRETISERYPILNISSATTYLKPIVRETDYPFLEPIINFFTSILQLPISKSFPTVKKGTVNSKQELSKEVSKLFHFVPAFGEKRWFIIVDEIERAHLAEIYHSIEVIERFKSAGSNGLPIQLIFIFCVSEAETKKLLENKNEPSQQISDFLFSNPKTVSNYEFIPQVSWNKKIEYVQKHLSTLRNDKAYKEEFDYHEKDTQNLKHPENSLKSTMGKDTPSLSYLIDAITILLGKSSPRIVVRICSDVRFKLNALMKARLQETEKIPYGFTQLLYLSFIRVKYPFLYNFLNTLPELVSPMTADNQHDSLIETIKSHEGEKKNLKDIVENTLEFVPEKNDWELIEFLLVSVEPKLKEYLYDKVEDPFEATIANAAYPDALRKYLYAGEEGQITEDYHYYSLFRQVETEDKPLSEVIENDEDLYIFAKHSRRLHSMHVEFHLSISQFIYDQMKSGSITIEHRKTKDTFYHHLTYEFLFHLEKAVNGVWRQTDLEKEIAKKAGALLQTFFEDESILVEAKMTILNSLYRESRSGDIHFQLDRMLEKFEQNQSFNPSKASKKMNNQWYQQYVRRKEDLYETSENFFFVLFQMWNGQTNTRAGKQSISQIRKIALRNLQQYSDAVEQYWNIIPYVSGDRSVNDALSHEWHFSQNIALYMPLESLIDVSRQTDIQDEELKEKIEFWSNQPKDELAKYQNKYQLEDGVTLKSALKNKNLL
jgi:guanylate kinase